MKLKKWLAAVIVFVLLMITGYIQNNMHARNDITIDGNRIKSHSEKWYERTYEKVLKELINE